jgi:hypothetical protein
MSHIFLEQCGVNEIKIAVVIRAYETVELGRG